MASPSFNNYKGSSEIPYNIIKYLFYNENIWKLIYYTTPDALSKPNLTAEQKAALLWTGDDHQENYRVFLVPMVENSIANQSVLLKLYKAKVRPTDAFKGVLLYAVEIQCETKVGMLDDGRARLDVLWEEIMTSLVGKDVQGVGSLFFNSGNGGDVNCSSNVTYDNTRNYFGNITVLGVRYSHLENGGC
jgi:hypothetical protein